MWDERRLRALGPQCGRGIERPGGSGGGGGQRRPAMVRALRLLPLLLVLLQLAGHGAPQQHQQQQQQQHQHQHQHEHERERDEHQPPPDLDSDSDVEPELEGDADIDSDHEYSVDLTTDRVEILGSEHDANKTAPLFPPDLFTQLQRRRGAIVLHVLGLVYMFVALAVVCDEFFVPSLDVIIEKLQISDDVAGATFMAAGGSAPELFTSAIGVFVSFDDVGIGTIVGSAVFNILFVIGMCAIFSKTVLTLTWWPLFRDCTFYSVSLLTLIYFFRDNHIYWQEALVLFSFYVLYVSFMRWNSTFERLVKKVIYKNRVTRVRSTDQLMPTVRALFDTPALDSLLPITNEFMTRYRHGNAATSSETSVGTGAGAGPRPGELQPGAPPPGGHKFRHGLLQLMIHTIDPMHDGKVDEKATQLHAIASLKVLLDATRPGGGAGGSGAGAAASTASTTASAASATSVPIVDLPNGQPIDPLDLVTKDETPPTPLDMSWPSSGRKRLTYLLLAPIIFPLWLTLPDTRTPKGKRLFPVTFLGSILWIAIYSYLMVWWANIVGDTANIPSEVMGLTFLAAGTSIPDLITSVIVARKGFGDMAVSSSVGSNIFDVTVGLPVPWLLYGIFYGKPVEVSSKGMVCSISILFMMLLFVIMSIACFHWRMNKGLGFTMFLLYFVFVAVSLAFEYELLVCPV
ncbi:sodium/potassium/calcium exchanger Nckx30C-like [Arctopsyche grandis]|uniref:sodium/potassium/calcium exchanger Nckx30C-like n=1 Tax=Arctopsyche grandis TaxID=121162 RepID=UPI00406D8CA3